VLLFIVGVHLIIIYGFSAGLVNKVIESLPPIIHGRLIYEPRAPKLPLPDPKPIAWQPVHAVWENLMPPESPPALTIDEIKPQLPPTSPPQPKPVTRVVGGPGPGFPNTGDFYPATSRQLGEAGVSAVQVCVDTHGRLTAEPQLKESSGSSRLDAGALALARAGSGHYRSTTEDGQPVASCYPFRIRFALK
jgi:TonB family protein